MLEVHQFKIRYTVCTCAIITHALYIFTSFLKSSYLFSRRFFSETLSLCMLSVQEWFVIKRGLWWCVQYIVPIFVLVDHCVIPEQQGSSLLNEISMAKKKTYCTVLLKQIFKHLVLTQVIIFHGLQSLNCPTNEICHTYLRVCRAGLFLTDHLFSPVIDIVREGSIRKDFGSRFLSK